MQSNIALPTSVKKYWMKHVWDRFIEEKNFSKDITDEFEQERIRTVDFIQKFRTDLNILDTCCGTGKVALELVKLSNVASVVGFDINTEAIKRAKKYSKGLIAGKEKLDFLVLDIDNMETTFSLSKYDAVLCLDALHHLPNPKLILHSLTNMTKIGGVVIVNVLSAEKFEEWETMKYGELEFKAQNRIFTSAIKNQDMRESMGESGVLRMNPFTKQELLSILPKNLMIKQFYSSYYHWLAGIRTSKSKV